MSYTTITEVKTYKKMSAATLAAQELRKQGYATKITSFGNLFSVVYKHREAFMDLTGVTYA